MGKGKKKKQSGQKVVHSGTARGLLPGGKRVGPRLASRPGLTGGVRIRF